MKPRLMRNWSSAALVGVLTVAGTSVAGTASAHSWRPTPTGPSSSDAPYLVPAASGVSLTSLLTVGDSVGGYRMVGVADGLGAFDNRNGTFTLLMNHELTSTAGVVRAHGATGAFVSRWVIDKRTLRVVSGSDLIQKVFLASPGGYVQTPGVALNRLCSADLAEQSAYYDRRTRTGYSGRIFTNGEESSGGRAFAHVVDTGESYELAAMGAGSWENIVANPSTGTKTVVIGTSDSGGGNITVYAGTKQRTGNPVEAAGLTNGRAWSIAVTDLPVEDGSAAVPDGPMAFTLAEPGQGTGFDRPEDGSWDPEHPDDFYFATTGSISKHSRLWRVRFADVSEPEKGGTVEMVLEGPTDTSTGPKMMDNVTVDDGKVLIQEDPGNNTYLAGIYRYDIAADTVVRIADNDPARFLEGGALFDTVDEETSGIIPVPFLGDGAYLFTSQNHTKLGDPELVEKGQLLLLRDGSGRDGHGHGRVRGH